MSKTPHRSNQQSSASPPTGPIEGRDLSRRERQIMDVIYRLQRATANQVMADLPPPPVSYSAVRALLRILVDKGHLHHADEGGKYVYAPVRPREHAGRSALKRVLETFFDNSAEQAVAALLDLSDDERSKLSPLELDRLARLIDAARKDGR